MRENGVEKRHMKGNFQWAKRTPIEEKMICNQCFIPKSGKSIFEIFAIVLPPLLHTSTSKK